MSDEVTQRRTEASRLAAEALRHLAWLADAGVAETPAAAPFRERAPAAAAAPACASARPAASAASPRAPEAPPEPVALPSAPPASSRAPAPSHAPAALASPPVEGAPAGGRYALSDTGCGSPELLAIRAELGECTRCKLGRGRTKLVFGVGSPRAELMFVGEGPGADEDRQGEPFVGRAGQLLTKMIEAMGYRRDEVYIANVVKCRPPENRNPEPDEMDACEPFLRRQIAAVRPRVIVALGRVAVQALLRDTTPISRLRGRWASYEGVSLMPTFHPAYLLRSPDEKKKAWEDLQLVMKELGKAVPRR